MEELILTSFYWQAALDAHFTELSDIDTQRQVKVFNSNAVQTVE